MEKAKSSGFTYMPTLIAKERHSLSTLRALEAMLETVQELRTKVNFERNQLITLIEMAKPKATKIPRELIAAQAPQIEKLDDGNRDPLILLDKLYNGAFCVSDEEEEEDEEIEDDDITRGDNFGGDVVKW